MILVGDSLGNVVLGYDSTIPVTLDDIVYHSRAVARGAEHTFIVADMPFMTYHSSVSESLQGIRRLMQEGHVHAVKLEGGAEIADVVKQLFRQVCLYWDILGLLRNRLIKLAAIAFKARTKRTHAG